MKECGDGDHLIDARKYAVLLWALGRARGALYSVMHGDPDRLELVAQTVEATALINLAKRFGYKESELAIDCDEYLTGSEQFIK